MCFFFILNPLEGVDFSGEISSFDEDGGGQSSLSQEDKLLLSRLLLLLNPAYPASYEGKSAAAASASRSSILRLRNWWAKRRQ